MSPTFTSILDAHQGQQKRKERKKEPPPETLIAQLQSLLSREPSQSNNKHTSSNEIQKLWAQQTTTTTKQNCKPKQKTDSGSKRSVEKYLKFPNINRTQRHRIIQPKKFWKKIFSSGSSERESQIELHLNLRILASDKKQHEFQFLQANKQSTKITFLRLVSFSALQPRFHSLGRA